MKKVITSGVALLIGLPISSFAADSSMVGNWEVSIGNAVNCTECAAGIRFPVRITDDSSNEIEFMTEGNITSITETIIFNSALAVVGELPFGGKSVLVFDLQEKRKVTEIYGYDLNISSNNRFLIYRKYFPRMLNPGGTTILLFDMQEVFEEDKSYITNVNPEDIGIPIYPEQERVQSNPDYELSPPFSLSSVQFISNNKAVVFSAIDQGNNLSLVRVLMPNEEFSDSFEICELPLIGKELVSEVYDKSIQNSVENIEVMENSNVMVRLYDTRAIATSFNVSLDSACALSR